MFEHGEVSAVDPFFKVGCEPGGKAFLKRQRDFLVVGCCDVPAMVRHVEHRRAVTIVGLGFACEVVDESLT